MESDQFLAWGAGLKDSRDPINRFVNARLEAALARLGERDLECLELPPRLFSDLAGSLIRSRIRDFLNHDPEVARFPAPGIGYWEYRHQSVYRGNAFPVLLPLSRTIRIGEVHVGIDKIGHFFGMGRRYYGRYRRALEQGNTTSEAMARPIRWGIMAERIAIGGLVDGIVSHADLEANYQGLLLARALCEADPPYLERTPAGWRLARGVDLAQWVTPAWDESYNTSHYLAYRWRQVRPILEQEVCPRYRSAEVQATLRRYQELDRPNLSRDLIEEFYLGRGVRPQDRHSLAVVCSALPPAAELAVARTGSSLSTPSEPTP